jgi:ectoine hydroxylase
MGNQLADRLDDTPRGPAELFARDGFLFIDSLFDDEEVATIRAEQPSVTAERGEHVVFELGSDTVRSVYGIHERGGAFAELARHPRLATTAATLLGSEVYVYQSKLNTKAVFGGDVWPWHQDYVYWRNEDGMPSPRVLTVAVFLDDVTDVNGPMSLIAGSHRCGVLDYDSYAGHPSGYEDRPLWIANLVAQLKYTVRKDAFVREAMAGGIVTPKGKAGSALFFDGNAAHASPHNLSPLPRTLALYTYNAVDNAPPAGRLHRPAFLASRDTRPIVPGHDDALRKETRPE